MKRLLATLAVLLVLLVSSGDARNTHGTPDPAIEQMAILGDWAGGYVVSGCLHVLTANTTANLPACRAYVKVAATGSVPTQLVYVEEAASAVTFTAGAGIYWLVLRRNTATNPVGWTCPPAIGYCWQRTDPAAPPATAEPQPPIPTGTLLVSRTVITAAAMTSVGDFRADSPLNSPVNALSPLFGVTGDCVTDDGPALQRALSNAAWRDRPFYIPTPPGFRKCYKSNNTLWLVHNTALNPNWPPDLRDQAGFHVSGDGIGSAAQTISDEYGASVLDFRGLSPSLSPIMANRSDAVSGINSCGPGSAVASRNITFKRLNIISNAAGWAVDFTCINSNVVLESLLVDVRNPAGSGIRFNDAYLATARDINVRYLEVDDDPAVFSTGVGFEMLHDEVSGAGLNTIDQVTVAGFGTGFRFGNVWTGDNPNSSGLTCISCQGVSNTINFEHRYADVTYIQMRSENCGTHGLRASHVATVTILSGRFTTTQPSCTRHLQFGNATNTPTEAREAARVTLTDMLVLNVMQYGLIREVIGPFTEYFTLTNTTFGEDPDVAINTIALEFGTEQVQEAFVTGLQFAGFEPGEGDILINNGKWVNYLQDENHNQINSAVFNLSNPRLVTGTNQNFEMTARTTVQMLMPDPSGYTVQNILGTLLGTGGLTAWVGQTITIINASLAAQSMTLIHNAAGTGNIRSSDNTDIVMPPNGQTTCIYSGTLWYCEQNNKP